MRRQDAAAVALLMGASMFLGAAVYYASPARADEDERIIRFVAALAEPLIAGTLQYRTTSGQPHEQPRTDILAHLFNHQTHHRGQAHTILSILTGREPPSLDLLGMQRRAAAPDLRALAAA